MSDMKILFIGNSHTFVHYVPLRVKRFVESHGIKCEANMLSHPGIGLDWHLKQSQTCFNLLYGNYDAVILQHNAHPFPGRDSLLESGKEIKKLIPEETKVYLYMTWSEKNNPGGQEIMSRSYEELAASIDAKLCPVGELWWKVHDIYPDELYLQDGEHSSVFGASLAASVIGRTLLQMESGVEQCYADAKRLENMEMDGRLPDLVFEEGRYDMRPLEQIQGVYHEG